MYSTLFLTSLFIGNANATYINTPTCSDISIEDGIDFQNTFFTTIIPTATSFETPIALRTLSAVDGAAFDCLATYSKNVLASLTKERPIIADKIPADMRTTNNRILCSAYSYSAVWDHIMGRDQLSILQPLYTKFNLNITKISSLIDQINACNFNLDCLESIALQANYCPDTVGVIVGVAYNEWLKEDGWNQDGSRTPFGECTANCRPYSDPLGIFDNRVPLYKRSHYAQYNGFFRWRNLLEDNGLGFFYKQEHVTPHIGFIGKPKIISKYMLQARKAPHPHYNYHIESLNAVEYVKNLGNNSYQKGAVELFDNKIAVDSFTLFRMDEVYNLSWELRIAFAMGVTYSEYDSVLLSWKEKVRYNAIRPTTPVQSGIFTPSFITTWGGPYQGIKEIRTQDFQPYIRVMPHAEYPSGSGCICRVLYEFTDSFIQDQFGDDTLNVTMPFPNILQPKSKIEPNSFENDIQYYQFNSMEEVYQMCGESRLWGGMHFPAAVSGAEDLCIGVGDDAYGFLLELLNGSNLKNVTSL